MTSPRRPLLGRRIHWWWDDPDRGPLPGFWKRKRRRKAHEKRLWRREADTERTPDDND